MRPASFAPALLALLATGTAAAADSPQDPPLAPAAAPASAPATQPEEPSTPAGLLDATITASRRKEVILESPRAATVVTRKDLDQHQSRTTPEALLEEPGVFVQRTNYGGGAPFVRGLFGNRILLLVDGVRLNNSTFRAGPNQFLNTVDPLLIDRIEVVRGTGSALHGSDAIGAAINVLSVQPAFDEAPVSGRVRLSGSTADLDGQVGAGLRLSSARLASVFTLDLRHFGDLRGGKDTGLQPFTGYDEWSGSGAASARIAEGQTLTLSVQSTRQFEVPRTDRSTPVDVRRFTLQDRQLVWLRHAAEKAGPFARLQTTASFNRQRELADRYRVNSDAQEHDDNRVGTLGLQLSGELAAHGSLVVGAETYVDFVKSEAARGKLSTPGLSSTPQLSRYGDSPGYQSAGLFAGHEWDLAPRLALLTEARVGFSRIALPEDTRLSQLFPAANLPVLAAATDVLPLGAGGVHVRFWPLSQLALSGGVSLGYRAPNLDDQARLGVEGGSYVLPTRGLIAEKALSGELNAKAVFGRLEASASYSYTYIFDAIGKEGAELAGNTVLDGGRVVRLVNADSARYAAWELSARVPVWRRLFLSANASWAFGNLTRQVPGQTLQDPTTLLTEPAEKVPPLFGKVALGWFAPRDAWFAEGLVRWATRQDRLGEADLTDPRICTQVQGVCRGTPGWATLALRGGVDLFRHARLVLQLENLFDKTYRMHASGVDGPGRSLTAMLEGSL